MSDDQTRSLGSRKSRSFFHRQSARRSAGEGRSRSFFFQRESSSTSTGDRGKSRSFYDAVGLSGFGETVSDVQRIATGTVSLSLEHKPTLQPKGGKDDPELPADSALSEKRNLSTAGLMFIAFFWIGGGIYGNEPLIESGPPAYTFALLLGCAIFYALPLALISAELGTALPYDGGMVAWVDETAGHTIGLHNMYWLWISYLFDSAAYPVLAAKYASGQWDAGVFTGDKLEGEAIIAMLIILVITIMKLAGTDYVVKMSGLFFVVSLLPSLIYMVHGSIYMKPKTWTVTDRSEEAGGWEPATLFSWVTWLYCGFNSLGSLAGEIKEPKKTYPIVVFSLLPMIIIMYVWPLMACLSLDDNRTRYEPGYFTDLAIELSGQWLGYCFIAGASVCFIGNYNADIIVCERSVAAFGEPLTEAFLQRRKRNIVLRYLLKENGTGVAPIFIIVNACLAAVLVWLPYNTLIEFSMLLMFLNMVLFSYAYLYYKFKRPDMVRPFSVPFGKFGAICVAGPVMLITGLTAFYSLIDEDEILGVPYAKSVGLLFFIVFGILVHLAVIGISKLCLNHSSRKHTTNGEEAPLLKGTVDG